MTSCKRSSSASSAIIEGINEDLLIEILLLLPAKSLVKFKAVSKKWRMLISATFFCRRHTLHHPRRRPEKQRAFILGNGRSTYHVCNPTVPRLIAVEFDLGFPHVDILQSCNGLLLLRCRRSSSGRNHYYVFNPTTMQRRDLSPLPFKSVFGIYLIFDPSLSPHYRVVSFVVYAKTSTLVYLYDSEIHEWKLRDERIPRVTHFYDGIYFNGGIYFLRFSPSSYRFTVDDNLTKIPPLRLIPSRGRKGSFPHYYEQRKNYLMESNGALLFFLRQQTNVLHVHETKEIESKWIKKYAVDTNPFMDGKFGICRVNLLSMILGEKEEDTLLLFAVPGKLMIYRFHAAVYEVLAESCSFRNAHHFIPSLAPV